VLKLLVNLIICDEMNKKCDENTEGIRLIFFMTL